MKTKQFKFNYEEGYEYVPTPFDEKNLTTDWLKDFFFDRNAVESENRNQIVGYGHISCQDEELVILEWGNNIATWKFIERNYLDLQDVTAFFNDLYKFLDTPGLALTAKSGHHEQLADKFQNQISVKFNAKVE